MTTLQPLRDAITQKTAARSAALETSRAALADAERLGRELAELQTNLRAGKIMEVAVTDHALLRYAERVLGFDSGEVVTKIRDRVGPCVAVLGDGKFPVCDGHVAVVKNRVVVTIEPA